jgi:hypothetical protein
MAVAPMVMDVLKRYYVGALAASDDSNGSVSARSKQNQVFAKFSYAFSN